MSVILAIDPGSEQSAWLMLRDDGKPYRFAIEPNDVVRDQLREMSWMPGLEPVIEWLSPRGMPTSAQEFETAFWAGRFAEALLPLRAHRLTRDRVKMHVCGNRAAKDANIRAALIDRFGGIGGKAAAVGTVKQPGPLHGVANDLWAALALAVAFADGVR